MSTIATFNPTDQVPLKPFTTICAWCNKVLSRRWTVNGGVSDGICADCKARVLSEYAALKGLRVELGKDREGKTSCANGYTGQEV